MRNKKKHHLQSSSSVEEGRSGGGSETCDSCQDDDDELAAGLQHPNKKVRRVSSGETTIQTSHHTQFPGKDQQDDSWCSSTEDVEVVSHHKRIRSRGPAVVISDPEPLPIITAASPSSSAVVANAALLADLKDIARGDEEVLPSFQYGSGTSPQNSLELVHDFFAGILDEETEDDDDDNNNNRNTTDRSGDSSVKSTSIVSL